MSSISSSQLSNHCCHPVPGPFCCSSSWLPCSIYVHTSSCMSLSVITYLMFVWWYTWHMVSNGWTWFNGCLKMIVDNLNEIQMVALLSSINQVTYALDNRGYTIQWISTMLLTIHTVSLPDTSHMFAEKICCVTRKFIASQPEPIPVVNWVINDL